MIEINLLPAQQKKAFETQETIKKVVYALIFLFSSILISAVFIFLAQRIYTQNLQAKKEISSSFEKYLNLEKNKETLEKIEKINTVFSQIENLEKSKSSVHGILIAVVNSTPGDINFSNIRVLIRDKKIELSGQAKKREALLEFQKNLQKSQYFENLSSPISNITSPENINFSISAGLTKKALNLQENAE